MVLAKEPVPGRVKTRLSPPCTPREAARLARAALADTLRAVRDTPAGRHVLVVDGCEATWAPDGFEVIPQRGRGLDERLAAAFEDAGGPALLIGMDTPQVTPELLSGGIAALGTTGIDAVLGATTDGGYWAVGLDEPRTDVFLGVPMSVRTTMSEQRARLRSLGLRHVELPVLRDVDYFDDACAVAETIRASDFAYELARVLERVRRIGA
jgi:rSAM/selenodomain-associated transferase 1